jgi:curved DNA-binding protein CbpA
MERPEMKRSFIVKQAEKPMKDYYKILGLPENASSETIKQSFRELAFEYHPDVSDYRNAESMFAEIYEAYHVLEDPGKRAVYDLLFARYIKNHDVRIPDEDNLKSGVINLANEARNEAARKVKIKYRDFIKDFDCFFIPGQKADGKPYSYNMHKNIGISGGPGPMGSIKSRTVSIPVPRSRKAQFMHRIGFLVKLSALIVAILMIRIDIFPEAGMTAKIFLFFAILLTGGLFTQLFYYLNATKSKFFQASKFPLVKKYSKNGYKRGFHPMVSTTPAGLIMYLLRLTF